MRTPPRLTLPTSLLSVSSETFPQMEPRPTVGERVGFPVGVLVGLTVGVSVGTSVGMYVGPGDGFSVG